MAEYSIRELAEKYELPISTLRYYEDIGLLKNVVHNDKNQRVYTEEHIARLDAIRCFKQIRLPLGKIRDFFQLEDNLPDSIDSIVDLVKAHEKDITEQIKELESGLLHIKHKVWFYSEIQKAVKTGTEWPHWEDYKK